MFGYFKVDADCPLDIGEHYKKYYCFLCRALEKYYGQLSRCLLSFDVALLLLIFAQEDYLSEIPKIHCFRKGKPLSQALTDDIAKKIATLHILLIAAKLDDDIRDEGGMLSKAAKTAAAGHIAKAVKNDPQMWQIIKGEYLMLHELEKQNATLDALEKQFSRMMVRVGTECFGLSDPDKINALDFAARWLYFIDAVDDLDENRKENTFNPFSGYGSFHVLKNRNYMELSNHFRQLYDKTVELPGNDNAKVLNYILFSKVPTETIRVLLKERA